VNDVGESIASIPTSLVIATIPTAPGTPSKVYSTLSAITIEWDASESDGGDSISTYAVKMESIEGDGFEVIGYTSATTITQGGLISGQEYYFQVVAINSVGESPDSTAYLIICGVVPE
jgi:endoglucanase